MFYEICGDVYRWVRKSTNLSQDTIGAAVSRERHTIMRWEKGEIVPSRAQEKTLFELTRCSRLRFAEFVCRKLTRYIGRAVVILPQGEVRGMPTTPLAEAQELLAVHYEAIPRPLRDRLLARITRLQVMQQVVEQEGSEMVQEVREYLRAMDLLEEMHEKR